jgi:hypothetical protein
VVVATRCCTSFAPRTTPVSSSSVTGLHKLSTLFEQVKVDEQTGTVTWPGDVDLDPDVIYAALDLGSDKARIYVLAPSVAA